MFADPIRVKSPEKPMLSQNSAFIGFCGLGRAVENVVGAGLRPARGLCRRLVVGLSRVKVPPGWAETRSYEGRAVFLIRASRSAM